jgi:hypothetical protein
MLLQHLVDGSGSSSSTTVTISGLTPGTAYTVYGNAQIILEFQQILELLFRLLQQLNHKHQLLALLLVAGTLVLQ